jgi:hypothetical protein
MPAIANAAKGYTIRFGSRGSETFFHRGGKIAKEMTQGGEKGGDYRLVLFLTLTSHLR